MIIINAIKINSEPTEIEFLLDSNEKEDVIKSIMSEGGFCIHSDEYELNILFKD